LDDEFGNSGFLAGLSEAMGASDYRADVHEKSWLVEGKYYGSAIVSNIILQEYGTLQLPNPRIEIDRPDGSHWILHDKTVQRAIICVEGVSVRLFNLHYFPFHRFNRNINEPEFKPIRTAFVEYLQLEDGMPTILTGDFNNADNHLRHSFPELFENDLLADAVQFESEEFHNYYNGNKFQLDHILYTSAHFSLASSRVIDDFSDHKGLVAEFQIRA
jgi:endonuclease/exonuclease/phosphatase (EEP) superfamily protein YafD